MNFITRADRMYLLFAKIFMTSTDRHNMKESSALPIFYTQIQTYTYLQAINLFCLRFSLSSCEICCLIFFVAHLCVCVCFKVQHFTVNFISFYFFPFQFFQPDQRSFYDTITCRHSTTDK